jgi:protein involved in polysaccharide export with SLBB domain
MNNRLLRGTGRAYVRRHLRIGLLLFLLLLLGGCRTPIYTTRSLPIEFQAPLVSPRPSIELEAGPTDGGTKPLIRPGDLVAITIVTERDRSALQPITAKVASDGSIFLPEVGNVEIGGLEPEFAQERIATALISGRVSSQPTVKIAVTLQAAYHISVAGAVARPGMIELPSGSSDVVAALRAAGGLSENAGTQVEIQHRKVATVVAAAPAPRTNINKDKDVDSNVMLASLTENATPQNTESPDRLTIDLSEQISGGVKNQTLDDGDTITVLPGKNRTFRMEGLTSIPGDVELKAAKDTHILDAIELGGGKVSQLADLAFIIRQLPSMDEPIIIQLSLARAKQDEDENLRVAPGDIVLVRRTMRSLVGGMFHVSAPP